MLAARLFHAASGQDSRLFGAALSVSLSVGILLAPPTAARDLGAQVGGLQSSEAALTGAWTTAAAMTDERTRHGATLLDDGRVLVTGGYGRDVVQGLTEIYDPATDEWLTGGPMQRGGWGVSLSVLPDGRVLEAGGRGPDGGTGYAEIYRFDFGIWLGAEVAFRGVSAGPHGDGTMTTLSDGRVLLAGGLDRRRQLLATSELFTPDAGQGTFRFTPSMTMRRHRATATELADGRVLMVGGDNSRGSLASAETFLPATQSWTRTGYLAHSRTQATATRLDNGRVLVVGGRRLGGTGGLALASAEVYNPATGTWSGTGSLATARYGQTATLLDDGRVLVVGGRTVDKRAIASAEIYDPVAGTWQSAGRMAVSRNQHTATLLPDGAVLVAGGTNALGHILSSVEVFQP